MMLNRTGSVFAAVVLAAGYASAQVSVVTANYGIDRTNANLQETILNPSNVAPGTFGKLGAYGVDGQIYAQPLYLENVVIGSSAHNVVYVATMHNTVYAFDADLPAGSAPLWSVSLGPPVPNDFYRFHDIMPEVGILSTPVIDPAAGVMYLVANTLESGGSVYRLHALDVTSGVEVLGAPVVIEAVVPGTAPDGSGDQVTFDPNQHLQRPGLLLLNNVVYMAFGSHGDGLPYHGWLIGYDAQDVQQQVSVLNTTPNGSAGSIWQAGNGPAADDAGNIYVAATNGDYDGVSNWGETFLELDPADGLSITSWFTPNNWPYMNGADFEVGNSAPMLLPGTDLLVGGGKLGVVYLMRRGNLGGMSDNDGQLVQSFQACNFGLFGRAFWKSATKFLAYFSAWAGPLQAFRLDGGVFVTDPDSQSAASFANPYSGLAVSANADQDGTGILWATTSDQTNPLSPGVLRAFDAGDLSNELWNSEMNPGLDRLGNFAKFAIPTVAAGKVFVPTFSGALEVYGLLPTLTSAPAGILGECTSSKSPATAVRGRC
jgi:hypothetical protein